ncbi:hypothetical protein IFR05_014495 [Cadophora sp. M221]|nr:hypothetical protein IFR05_014495 [Cadophora sp. M221]
MAKKSYTKAFGTEEMPPETWINFEKDVLYITKDFCYLGFRDLPFARHPWQVTIRFDTGQEEPFRYFYKSLKKDIRRVKDLAVSGHWTFGSDSAWSYEPESDMGMFTTHFACAERVTLVDPQQAPEQTSHLRFTKINPYEKAQSAKPEFYQKIFSHSSISTSAKTDNNFSISTLISRGNKVRQWSVSVARSHPSSAALSVNKAQQLKVIPQLFSIVPSTTVDCLKADLVKHKPTCRRLQDRQKLYRVGGVTQKLFLIFKELTWCQWKIDAIEKVGEVLTLRGSVRYTPIRGEAPVYDPMKSITAVKTEGMSWAQGYGDGSVYFTGIVYKDTITVGSLTVANFEFEVCETSKSQVGGAPYGTLGLNIDPDGMLRFSSGKEDKTNGPIFVTSFCC